MTLLNGNVIHKLLVLQCEDNGNCLTHFNSSIFTKVSRLEQIG